MLVNIDEIVLANLVASLELINLSSQQLRLVRENEQKNAETLIVLKEILAEIREIKNARNL